MNLKQISDHLCGVWLVAGVVAVFLSMAAPQQAALSMTTGGIEMSQALLLNPVWFDATGDSNGLRIPEMKDVVEYEEKKYIADLEKWVKQQRPVVIFCHSGCGRSRALRTEAAGRFPQGLFYYLQSGDAAILRYQFEHPQSKKPAPVNKSPNL